MPVGHVDCHITVGNNVIGIGMNQVTICESQSVQDMIAFISKLAKLL